MDPLITELLSRRIDDVKDELTLTRATLAAGFEKQNKKLDELLEFKWKIAGGVIAVSALITVTIQVVFKVWHG